MSRIPYEPVEGQAANVPSACPEELREQFASHTRKRGRPRKPEEPSLPGMPTASTPVSALDPPKTADVPRLDAIDNPSHPLFALLNVELLEGALPDLREQLARRALSLLAEVSTWRRVKKLIMYGNTKELLAALKLTADIALQASAPVNAGTSPIAVQIINHVPRPEGAPSITLSRDAITPLETT